ncbi:putative disease resistance protein RGA3 [Ananas comosus]|uniref:Disease resistance protein RGA3 n=1 Tax=Ananas comosus TaxID=4615 RepID=A0A6P5EL97_ANACO|nr:putative disease resistance protein RGA3 [Ananas comosus]
MAALEVLFGICAEKLAALIHDKAAAILGVKEELGKLQRRMDRIDCALIHDKAATILGVREELGKLQRRMEWIDCTLKDAGWRRTNKDAATTTTNCWLTELKSILHEANDVFDDCRSEGGKLLDNKLPSASSGLSILRRIPLISNFSSVLVRNKIAERIRKLNDRIDEVGKDGWILNLELAKPEGRAAPDTSAARETCEIMEADVVGREIEDATDRLAEVIITNDRRNFQVTAVTGMGGIGKTTLAQKVYNNPRIGDNFQVRIWICVTQKYSDVRLLQEITRKAGGGHGSAERVSELLPILCRTLGGRSIFLVLDDVWQSDVWTDLLRNPLQNGSAASGCVLVTTRDQNVAMRMGAKHVHRVEKMSVDSGWELLCKKTYLEEEGEDAQSLRSVGVRIVNKCGGLPLAIRVIAGLLTTKEKSRKEWEKVLRSNAWSMSELPEEFRGALYLSYDDLPPHLKQCFLSLCLYPEDDVHSIRDLRRMWVAEGFVDQVEGLLMEELAEQYYFELIRRSLLQPDPRYVVQARCTIHDLLRSLGQYLSQGESYYGDPQCLDATAISKLRRLSIAESGEIVTIPGPETERLRLRTLLLTASPPRIEHNLFSRVPYLHILILNGQGIECIPDSVGSLIHLRLLDLDRTSISNLPDSIGFLTNLQTLNLQHCNFLNTLPRSIIHLCSLRRLGLLGTPLRRVPEGIGRLQLLNDLEGFIINAGDSCNTERNSWDLEELKSLRQLRWLQLSILGGERNANSVQSTDDLIDQPLTVTHPRTRASVLEDKAFLKELTISCRPQSERGEVPPYTEEEISKIEDIFEKLHPPPCLEVLGIQNFYGRQISSCMLPPSLGTYFPYLTGVNFIGLPLCSQLPPLGQLPHLRYLRIKNALAIVTIGPELLGNGVGDGVHAATAFPNLEFFIMIGMPNWEEWTLVGSETRHSSSCSLRVMPRLEELHVIDCPKLRALPKSLQQLRALRILRTTMAHSLSVIQDFLFISELRIEMNNGIERVSNLPSLKKLIIWDTPALKCVDNLVALQHLELQDYSMESLPEWLLRLVQQRLHLRDKNLQLVMRCSTAVIQRCLKGGPDWPIIECFSCVSAYTEDRSAYLEYTKQSGCYRTNQ